MLAETVHEIYVLKIEIDRLERILGTDCPPLETRDALDRARIQLARLEQLGRAQDSKFVDGDAFTVAFAAIWHGFLTLTSPVYRSMSPAIPQSLAAGGVRAARAAAVGSEYIGTEKAENPASPARSTSTAPSGTNNDEQKGPEEPTASAPPQKMSVEFDPPLTSVEKADPGAPRPQPPDGDDEGGADPASLSIGVPGQQTEEQQEPKIRGLDAIRARAAARGAASAPPTAELIAARAADAAKVPVYRTDVPERGSASSTPVKGTVLAADMGISAEVADVRKKLQAMSELEFLASVEATRAARAKLANTDTSMGRYNRKTHDSALVIAAQVAAEGGIVIPPVAGAPGRKVRDERER